MNIELPDNLKLFKFPPSDKFPPSAEIMLFLISEEMKNRRHLNRLVQAGFDSTYACDLSSLILILAGFDSRPDDLYEWYKELLDEQCEKSLPADAAEWKEAVFDMYVKLLEKVLEG